MNWYHQGTESLGFENVKDGYLEGGDVEMGNVIVVRLGFVRDGEYSMCGIVGTTMVFFNPMVMMVVMGEWMGKIGSVWGERWVTWWWLWSG